MSAPSWAPPLEYVADYITSRTLNTVTPGSDTPTGIFDDTTYPTGAQVERVIEGACAWVTSVTGDIVTSLEDAARTAASLRAAAMVELSYPLRNNEIDEVAQVLLAQAQAARDELVAANLAGGGGTISPAGVPVFSFPDASPWCGDSPAWRHS